jgi:hypothetical protein
MVWNFKPQLRAFRFAGHKVRIIAAGAAMESWHASPSSTQQQMQQLQQQCFEHACRDTQAAL